MTFHEIVRATIKMTGLVLLVVGAVRASSTLPILLESLSYGDAGRPVISWSAGLVAPILFGAFLWLFPKPLADRFVDVPLPQASRDEWLLGLERLGIRLMGLSLLYFAVSSLVSGYAGYVHAKEAVGTGFAGEFRYNIAFWVDVLEIVMAMALILGARGLTSLFHGLHYAGWYQVGKAADEQDRRQKSGREAD